MAKAKLTTRAISSTTVTSDNLAKGSQLTHNQLDSNFLNLRDQSFGIAADDSATIQVGAGDTLYIQGGSNVTTSTDSAGVVTINATSDVTGSSTTTFTNKTFDANGTGNSITNLEVADLASGVLDTDISSVSGSDDTLASAKAIKTYVDSEVSGVATGQGFKVIGDDSAGVDIPEAGTLYIQGGTNVTTSTDSAGVITINAPDTTLSLIDEDDMSTDSATRPPSQQSVKAYVDSEVSGVTAGQGFKVVGDDSASVDIAEGGTVYIQGGTNVTTATDSAGVVTINAADNSLSLIDEDGFGTDSATRPPSQQSVKAYVDAQDANIASDTLTLTNKTFNVEGTGNSISNIDVADLKSGVLDTDLSSVSGSDDTLASAKAIKAYVDASSGSGFTVVGDDSAGVEIAEGGTVYIQGGDNVTTSTDSAGVVTINATDNSLSLIDEDDMSTDSATRPPSQQSVKAYVDGQNHTSLSGSTDNTIATVTGANALAGEANLTFDGSTLGVTGAATVSTTLGVTGASTLDGVTITDNTISTNSSNADLELHTNGTGDTVFMGADVDNTGDVIIRGDQKLIFNPATSATTSSTIEVTAPQSGVGNTNLSLVTPSSGRVKIGTNNPINLRPGEIEINSDGGSSKILFYTPNAGSSANENKITIEPPDRTTVTADRTIKLPGDPGPGTSTQQFVSDTMVQTLSHKTLDSTCPLFKVFGDDSAGVDINGQHNLYIQGGTNVTTATDSAGVVTINASADSAPVTALNNQSANRLTTIGATTTELDGEANLTFDGSTLGVTGTLAVTGAATVSTTLGVTGASTLDGVTITDNTISSNASNADLEISGNGTGNVSLSSDGTFSSQATSTFTDNFGAGSRNKGVHIFRAETIGSALTSSSDRRQGHLVGQQYTLGNYTSSDKDNRYRAQTVGVAVDLNGATVSSTNAYAGAMGAQGQAAVENRDASNAGTMGNTIGMMAGSYFYTPQTITITNAHGVFSYVETDDGGGDITITNAYPYKSQVNKYHGTITNGYNFYVDSNDATNKFAFYSNVSAAQSRMGAIRLDNQSGDPTNGADFSWIYAKDDSGSSEVHVRDEAGNVTKISPHNTAGEWEYYSVNKHTGKTVRVNMERMIRKLEEVTGETFIETV